MYKNFFSLSVGFCLALVPILARADEAIQKAENQAKRLDGLQQTQQRLNELIKAAANQNLVDVNSGSTLNNGATKAPQSTKSQSTSAVSQDCGTDFFSFPSEVKSVNYDGLKYLKNQVIINGDQINPEKLKVLAMAYLGLGFGEEALLASTILEAPEETIMRAQATTLLETVSDDDRDFIRAQALCHEGAKIWLDVLSPQNAPLTDMEIKQLKGRLSTLPLGLRNILGQRLGLKALKADDRVTAKALYKTLIKQAAKHPTTHKKIMTADVRFFEAMLAIKSSDEEQKKLGARKLKAFAKKDNPHQIDALQALSEYLMKDNKQQGHNETYSGYNHDLDAAAQIYSQDDKGKQALVQKIIFLARNHELARAIVLAQDNFVNESTFFEGSVREIGKYVYDDLKNSDANIKLNALEIFIREAAFFNRLENDEKIRHAGVAASAQLELPKLAAKIMPMDTWHELDAETLALLALSFGQDLRKPNIAAAFPKHILLQAEFKAIEIEQAFANKNPGSAMEILNSAPKNDIVQNAFVTHSWSAGYWSLVGNSLPTKSQKKLPRDNKAHHRLSAQAQSLAATLSTNAPILPATNKFYGINELTSLQQYLENDLSVFTTYLNWASKEITKTTNG